MKIKISWLWILFLPFVVVAHFYKVVFFLFVLMSIHESFHILCASYFGYRIESVCIYPFGLSAQIQYFEYRKSWEEIVITLCGLSVHIIAAFFIPFLCEFMKVSLNFTNYLMQTNLAILFFNLLPIYPLDGGRIFRNILEYVFTFKIAKLISLLSSILFIPILFSVFPFTLIQCGFFSLFFISQVLIYMYQFNADVYTFYLYRFLHPKRGKLRLHHQKDIYKNNENIIVNKGKVLTERDFLEKYIE